MRNPYDDEMHQRGRYGQAGSRRDYDRDQDPSSWRSGRQHYGGSYNRDYDQERWRSGRAYGRDYDEERWRDDQAGDIDYERWYRSNRGRDEYSEHDQERWRPSDQRYSGPYRHDYDENPRRGSQRYRGWYGDDDQGRSRSEGQGYTAFSRDYDQDRWRSEGRGYRGSYGRDYDQERWGSGGQSYGGSFDRPISWSYTEFGLIPGPFTGRGPRGYQRSDERIKEETCDRLTQHGQIDASDMEVQVKNGEVTLTGSVPSREAKRMAEDAVESVQGVREVHNQLRVQQSQQAISSQWASQRQESMPERQQTAGQQQDQQRAVGGTENRS